TGQPRILNSSSLTLEGKRVVFFGIDPAMPRMPCEADGRGWDCGTAALRTLMNLIGREPVACEPRGIDPFDRVFAKCTVHGQDIALALIEAGMAVALPAETNDYVAAEQAAKAKKIGMWRGPFKTPQEFRKMLSPEPQPR